MKDKPEAFCKKLGEAALAVATETRKRLGEIAAPDESLKNLRILANERGRVGALKGGLWKNIEIQFVLPGYVRMFDGRVIVSVYEVGLSEDGSLRPVRKSTTYPDQGAAENAKSLHLLHWRYVEHYDELKIT